MTDQFSWREKWLSWREKQPSNTEDTSKYTPEQRKVLDKINELNKTLETVQAKKMFTEKWMKILLKYFQKNPALQKDPEAQTTINLYKSYSQRFKDAVKQWWDIESKLKVLENEVVSLTDHVEYLSWINEKWESLKLDNEKLKTITSKNFLALPQKERLQYITLDHPDSDSVASWSIKDITFNFDQDWDGKINKELYMLTTAWQVLPKEVREVTKEGKKYTRVWLNWEFYFWEKRLTIHDKTQITIDTLATNEQIKVFNEKNTQAYNEFVKQNQWLQDEKYKNVIIESIEKGIEPKIFLKVLSRRVENFETQNPLNPVEAEFIATEITKISWYGKTWLEEVAKVLRRVTPTTWEWSLKELWFDKEAIETYSKSKKDDSMYDMQNLRDFPPWEYSYPIERSASWTTLCSKTARLNLEKLWIKNPSTWSSAREAYDNLWSPKDPFPPAKTDAKVADVYLDARSEKNKDYGHRVAAFQKEGQWYVLDPYYSMFWNTREPIPAQKYIDTISDKQKVWWVKYYS
jgi:hypothetical protein